MLFLDELNHLEENTKAVEEEFSRAPGTVRKKARRHFPVTGCAPGKNCAKSSTDVIVSGFRFLIRVNPDGRLRDRLI